MKLFKKFAPVIAAALGVIAIIMIFLPAIVAGKNDYSGLKIVFGYKETVKSLTGESKVELLKFSFMNLLPYLLVLAGAALCVLSFLGKGNKYFAYVAIACFALAAIFFFCVIPFTLLADYLQDAADKLGVNAKEEWKLGAGSVIAAICSILAAACTAAPIFLKD